MNMNKTTYFLIICKQTMDYGDVIIEGTKRNKFDSVSLVYIKRQIISSLIGYFLHEVEYIPMNMG